jgi:histone acetyltransferase (RNA polymerase elongator complex component)
MNHRQQEPPSRPLIIPFFISNRGCPHRCAFCRGAGEGNGGPQTMTRSDMEDAVTRHLSTAKPDRRAGAQIAFYGGNFTGLDSLEQDSLLDWAGRFIEAGVIHSLRISTRPDFIGRDEIKRLKAARVKTVEIGAQSMVDEVLNLSRRGHSAEDVREAVGLLKENGFETGVHLMAGLPGDSRDRFLYSVDEVVRLNPDLVRIHPVLVFANTALAAACNKGEYEPLSMNEAVGLCGIALRRFETAGIRVVRIGLQPESDMERPGVILGGPYHPAFRSLVEGALFFEMASMLLASAPEKVGKAAFSVSPDDHSFFRGLNNANLVAVKARAYPAAVTVATDPGLPRGTVRLDADGHRRQIHRVSQSVFSPGGDGEFKDV